MTTEATLTSQDYILKEYYTKDFIGDIVFKNRPLFAMVPKDPNWQGSPHPIPVIYSRPQGRSAAFATAQTNSTSSKGVAFNLTHAENYAVAAISNLAWKSTKSDSGAFIGIMTTEMDGAFNNIANDLAVDLYRDGFGMRAQAGSISTTSLTLLDIKDVVNFEVGMELKASPNADGSSPRTGSATVTAVNRSTGVLTSDANWTTQITSFAANDYVFVEGDNDGTGARLKVAGLAAWNPTTAPGATAFFGVNRTVDSRLYGVITNGTSSPIEEALIDGMTDAGVQGGTIDHIFLNYSNYANLEKALGSKVQYVEHEVGNVGFRGMMVYSANAAAKVFADRFCPSDRAHCLQLDTWCLASTDDAPHVDNTDGNMWLRQTNSAGLEVRIESFAQLGCAAPGWNDVVTL